MEENSNKQLDEKEVYNETTDDELELDQEEIYYEIKDDNGNITGIGHNNEVESVDETLSSEEIHYALIAALMDIYKDKDMDEIEEMIKSISSEEWAEMVNEKIDKENARKSNKKTIKRVLIAAGALALVALVATEAITTLKSKQKDKPKTETREISSLEELLNLLSSTQKETFTKINDVQNYFNNVAAPSIKKDIDKNSQLYLNINELRALYAYANADTFTKDTLAERLLYDVDVLEFSKDYAKSGVVLNTYYRYATEKSGISDLFSDKNNKEMFESFEKLVLAYNKDNSAENKEKITNKLLSIYLSGNIDSLKDENKEAASFIATLILPSLYERGIVNKNTYETIIKINETITCNDLEGYINDAEISSKENKTSLKITEDQKTTLYYLLDEKNIKTSSRNIDIENRENGKLNDNSGYTNNNNNNSSKGTKREEISKDEANKTFSDKEIKNAESKANQEFNDKYEEKNNKEKAYAEGLSKGYAISYSKSHDAYMSNNTTLTSVSFKEDLNKAINSYNGKYLESYKEGLVDGIASGIKNGIKDAKDNKARQEEFEREFEETTKKSEERVTTPTKPAQEETTSEDIIIIKQEVEEERYYSNTTSVTRVRK